MLIELTKKLVIERLPGRPDTGHKGTFGHVFIVGGSLGFTGAMKLAGLGAARAGAGLVTLGVPESLMTIVGAQMLECMTFAVGESPSRSLGTNGLEAALEFAAGKDAVVLGPGCSRHPDTREFVLAFVRKCPVPLLIDADGLNNLSTDAAALNQAQAPVLVTPHPGEMARLAGTSISDVQSDRPNTARKFASDYGCTVVLKGAGTIIASPTADTYVNPTGNEGMGTGGTGDVLAGLIGGLMAQGLTCADAAVVGVYVHGLAGDIAAGHKTRRGMIAGDLVEAIPEAWKQLEQEAAS
ncbi:MAG TPA: NAD(P)H-hydrate dehydratase [Candidatus Hydrogenedentes bacterium]|nr:NAD(P)H-hydrate dehydratase [Candidatus Hydrogenedentota bacterium]HQM49587.1 NAD(P)H-hydrate dehydratase [Candidatus Hydrogenedentota bacterium]